MSQGIKYLLDTNALIALRGAVHGRPPKDAARAQQAERIRAKLQTIPAQDVAMSPITLGELRHWVEKHAQREKAEALLAQLLQNVRCVGLDGALPAQPSWSEHYGKALLALEKVGEKIGTNDLWIAAHALSLDATVVTNNIREFQRVPQLRVEDWTT
jgi:tRNA(fMet)-specific endonuclease VapC